MTYAVVALTVVSFVFIIVQVFLSCGPLKYESEENSSVSVNDERKLSNDDSNFNRA